MLIANIGNTISVSSCVRTNYKPCTKAYRGTESFTKSYETVLSRQAKVSYTYDCENTRIATEEGGITTEYVTDNGGSLSRLLIAYENIGTANTSETWI